MKTRAAAPHRYATAIATPPLSLRHHLLDLGEIQTLPEYPLCSIVKFNYHKTRHQASASMDAGRVSELSRY
jgi:hypothetical protein